MRHPLNHQARPDRSSSPRISRVELNSLTLIRLFLPRLWEIAPPHLEAVSKWDTLFREEEVFSYRGGRHADFIPSAGSQIQQEVTKHLSLAGEGDLQMGKINPAFGLGKVKSAGRTGAGKLKNLSLTFLWSVRNCPHPLRAWCQCCLTSCMVCKHHYQGQNFTCLFQPLWHPTLWNMSNSLSPSSYGFISNTFWLVPN